MENKNIKNSINDKEKTIKSKEKSINSFNNLESIFFEKSVLKEDLKQIFYVFSYWILLAAIVVVCFAVTMINNDSINIEVIFFVIDVFLIIACCIFYWLASLALNSSKSFATNYKILKEIIVQNKYKRQSLQESAVYYASQIIQIRQNNTIFMGIILPIIISFIFSFNSDPGILLTLCLLFVLLLCGIMNTFKILNVMKNGSNIYNFKFLQKGIHQYFNE